MYVSYTVYHKIVLYNTHQRNVRQIAADNMAMMPHCSYTLRFYQYERKQTDC